MRGKDPEAVVVTFLSGEPERCCDLLEEVRRLLPDRRHFAVSLGDAETPPKVVHIRLDRAPAGDLWLHLRRHLKAYRIGMAAVLFDGARQYRELRLAAFWLAPGKLLAYNGRLERHHLQWRCWVASLLFWLGVPLDRIWLRPWWLWPWRREQTVGFDAWTEIEGRPLSETRSRMAVLTPYLPWPLGHGGAVRVYYLLREMAVEFDIFLFAFYEEEHPPPAGPLADLCARLILVRKGRYREPRWASLAPPEVCEYRSAGMRRAIEDVRRRFGFQVLQAEYTHLGEYDAGVLVAHDLTWDLYRQVWDKKRIVSAWWNQARWRWFERRALRGTARVVVMSEKDLELCALPHATVIANGVDLARFAPAPEHNGRHLLFVGSFRHFPNVVGFRFFLEEVWPRLTRRLEDVTMTVVGGPDARLHWRNFSGERDLPRWQGIKLLEFVADVVPLYQEANLVVVPTLVSAGTNLKVLEAMAMERAIVSTTSGVAGIALRHGESVWIADSGEEFAGAVEDLLCSPPKRSAMARRARTLAEQHYSWRKLGLLQRRLLCELMSPGPLAVRSAGPADLNAIDRIQREATGAALWPAADYLRYDCLVAEVAGEVCGFAAFRTTHPAEGEVLNLAVAVRWRRRGVGRRLAEEISARSTGDMLLEVRESNLEARNLYKKIGFVEEGRRPGYYETPPETAIVMRLRKC